MRVLVTGSRAWRDRDMIWFALSTIAVAASDAGEERMVVVHGCAQGADMMADLWVRRNEHPLPVSAERHPANWKKYGTSAGYRRNAAMVRLGADVCLAFIANNSAGATMCAEMADEAGIRTEVYMPREP